MKLSETIVTISLFAVTIWWIWYDTIMVSISFFRTRTKWTLGSDGWNAVLCPWTYAGLCYVLYQHWDKIWSWQYWYIGGSRGCGQCLVEFSKIFNYRCCIHRICILGEYSLWSNIGGPITILYKRYWNGRLCLQLKKSFLSKNRSARWYAPVFGRQVQLLPSRQSTKKRTHMRNSGHSVVPCFPWSIIQEWCLRIITLSRIGTETDHVKYSLNASTPR